MKYLALGLLISLPTFASVTVSGISSGAYMAQQFHMAFSSEVKGVGLIAGGPYYCAKGKMLDALNKCMQVHLGTPEAKDSLAAADKEARAGRIDPIQNIGDSRVYILGGTNDDTVVSKVVDVLTDTYKAWKVPSEAMLVETTLPVGHAFPTESFGNPCPTPSEPPFISNCGRDVAGEMLQHLLGDLSPKVSARQNRLFSFNQLTGVSLNVDQLSMNRLGYAYVPQGCEKPERAGCRIHIAFHGCRQTIADVKDTFMRKTGYNEWAEANRLVIFYPQAIKSLNNPKGCWDWWGYTGQDYHTKKGAQIERVRALYQQLKSGDLRLTTARFQ